MALFCGGRQYFDVDETRAVNEVGEQLTSFEQGEAKTLHTLMTKGGLNEPLKARYRSGKQG
jgi:hypothetical protein